VNKSPIKPINAINAVNRINPKNLHKIESNRTPLMDPQDNFIKIAGRMACSLVTVPTDDKEEKK
jgi:hypothetical protein